MKRHPDMRPYDELDEADKEKDRVQIRELADNLRALEFKMVVRPGTDPHV